MSYYDSIIYSCFEFVFSLKPNKNTHTLITFNNNQQYSTILFVPDYSKTYMIDKTTLLNRVGLIVANIDTNTHTSM